MLFERKHDVLALVVRYHGFKSRTEFLTETLILLLVCLLAFPACAQWGHEECRPRFVVHKVGDLVLRWQSSRQAAGDSADMSPPDALVMQTRHRQKISPFLVRYRSALKPQTCAELAIYGVRVRTLDERNRWGVRRTFGHARHTMGGACCWTWKSDVCWCSPRIGQ